MDSDIPTRINTFKASLLEKSVPQIIQRYITFGTCFILDEDKYFELKSEVAEFFKIHPSEVIVVGSGKLGFSIAPKKRYKAFNNESSDVDVAIISSQLFDRFWQDSYDYKSGGAYGHWPEANHFNEYLFKGWIRPDKLPNSPHFSQKKEWFEFFRKLTNSGKYSSYKISAGLYKSWYFLEEYQSICVKECRQEIEKIYENISHQ